MRRCIQCGWTPHFPVRGNPERWVCRRCQDRAREQSRAQAQESWQRQVSQACRGLDLAGIQVKAHAAPSLGGGNTIILVLGGHEEYISFSSRDSAAEISLKIKEAAETLRRRVAAHEEAEAARRLERERYLAWLAAPGTEDAAELLAAGPGEPPTVPDEPKPPVDVVDWEWRGWRFALSRARGVAGWCVRRSSEVASDDERSTRVVRYHMWLPLASALAEAHRYPYEHASHARAWREMTKSCGQDADWDDAVKAAALAAQAAHLDWMAEMAAYAERREACRAAESRMEAYRAGLEAWRARLRETEAYKRWLRLPDSRREQIMDEISGRHSPEIVVRRML